MAVIISQWRGYTFSTNHFGVLLTEVKTPTEGQVGENLILGGFSKRLLCQKKKKKKQN